MPHPLSSWPPERPEHLTELLREQGATPEECADLLPVLRRLSAWQAPQPSPADTRRLLTQLTPELPPHSLVRQAIRGHRGHRFPFLLATARAQVRLFGLGFWLVSALTTLIGAMVVLSNAVPDQAVVLRLSGPLLAYLGTIVAFRGREKRTLELELVCLPSPLQLALARLVIVLGYDVGLSLALSLMLWVGGASQVLVLTCSWLMPLLLVAGLALVLSLRLALPQAAALAYGSWLALLATDVASGHHALPLTVQSEVLLGSIGTLLLGIALGCFRAGVPRLLSHT